MGVVIGVVLAWFIVEMLLWALIAQFISGWYVFFWFIIAAFLGIGMIKNAAKTLNPMAKQAQSGFISNPANIPAENTIIKAVAYALAGFLLLLPGLLSDLIAALLLLPFVQKIASQKAKNYAAQNQAKIMEIMAKQMGGQSPFGMGAGGNPFGASPFGAKSTGGKIIDGTATPVQKSANDEN